MTYIYQGIGFYDFRAAFEGVRPDDFSYEGLVALYDWLEEYVESTGEPIELDVIALCCEFTETTFNDVVNDYSDCPRFEEFEEDGDNWKEAVTEWLMDNTVFIPVDDDTFIIGEF